MTQQENQSQSIRSALINLSPQDFLRFGTPHLAYIRPIEVNNRTAYALYAADGVRLSIQPSVKLASAYALQSDLDPVTVQ